MKFSSLLVSTTLAAIAGTSTAESTCCNALPSNGCALDPTFPVQQMGFTSNGVQLVICCADIPSTSIVNSFENNPTCAGSDIPPPPAPVTCETLKSQFQDCTCAVQCKDGETNCLGGDSSDCGDATETFCVGKGSSVRLSCGYSSTVTYVPASDNIGDITNDGDTSVSSSTPADIDNISNNGELTIGGSPSGMSSDLAASCEALESQFQDCTCSVQCKDGETKCLEADGAGCGDAAKTFCVGQGSSVYMSCGHSETHSETHSGSTEYVCKNGEYCTLSSNGGVCSPIGQGLPFGSNFMPVLIGSGASTTVSYNCIGINAFDLVSGGGSCQMSCPDTCKVTPDVTNPCGSTPSAGFASSTSVVIGASVAFLAMIFV